MPRTLTPACLPSINMAAPIAAIVLLGAGACAVGPELSGASSAGLGGAWAMDGAMSDGGDVGPEAGPEAGPEVESECAPAVSSVTRRVAPITGSASAAVAGGAVPAARPVVPAVPAVLRGTAPSEDKASVGPNAHHTGAPAFTAYPGPSYGGVWTREMMSKTEADAARRVAATPPMTRHSPSRGTFDGVVEPRSVCGPWHVAQENTYSDGSHCYVRGSYGDMTLVQTSLDWDHELLLVRPNGLGGTQVTRVAVFGDGVNWGETLTVHRFERVAEYGDRIVIELGVEGYGGACMEPESYASIERKVVFCDDDLCSRPIPLERRDVTTTYPDYDAQGDQERGVERVTLDFALRVRMSPEGVRVSRRRGRVGPRFREFLGRHSLEDLAPES